jgi:hypothetical protein
MPTQSARVAAQGWWEKPVLLITRPASRQGARQAPTGITGRAARAGWRPRQLATSATVAEVGVLGCRLGMAAGVADPGARQAPAIQRAVQLEQALLLEEDLEGMAAMRLTGFRRC